VILENSFEGKFGGGDFVFRNAYLVLVHKVSVFYPRLNNLLHISLTCLAGSLRHSAARLANADFICVYLRDLRETCLKPLASLSLGKGQHHLVDCCNCQLSATFICVKNHLSKPPTIPTNSPVSFTPTFPKILLRCVSTVCRESSSSLPISRLVL